LAGPHFGRTGEQGTMTRGYALPGLPPPPPFVPCSKCPKYFEPHCDACLHIAKGDKMVRIVLCKDCKRRMVAGKFASSTRNILKYKPNLEYMGRNKLPPPTSSSARLVKSLFASRQRRIARSPIIKEAYGMSRPLSEKAIAHLGKSCERCGAPVPPRSHLPLCPTHKKLHRKERQKASRDRRKVVTLQ